MEPSFTIKYEVTIPLYSVLNVTMKTFFYTKQILQHPHINIFYNNTIYSKYLGITFFKLTHIGKLINITITSATNAYKFFPTLSIIGCAYNNVSTIDLAPIIPIATEKTIEIPMKKCLNFCFFIFDVILQVNPTIKPITIFPIAHPGIPCKPLISKQYKKTPNTPTVIPLIGP